MQFLWELYKFNTSKELGMIPTHSEYSYIIVVIIILFICYYLHFEVSLLSIWLYYSIIIKMKVTLTCGSL